MLPGSRKCDCLDGVFEGKTVKMSGTKSLENLFGVDRHLFPKNLTKVRSGREIGYNLDIVLQCMVALLSDAQRQWLPDPKFRDTILRRVIHRARTKSDELALALEEKLRPFLIYSG
jgi:hypothetical protein